MHVARKRGCMHVCVCVRVCLVAGCTWEAREASGGHSTHRRLSSEHAAWGEARGGTRALVVSHRVLGRREHGTWRHTERILSCARSSEWIHVGKSLLMALHHAALLGLLEESQKVRVGPCVSVWIVRAHFYVSLKFSLRKAHERNSY